jgi:hypothetical protein
VGSVFLINVPIIGIALISAIVPETKNPEPGKIDPTGVVLSIAGLSLLIWHHQGRAAGHRRRPKVLVPALTGIALLAVFVVRAA